MKLPEESELVPLVKKGASVLVLKNMCINLVLKIQQSKNKDHLALHNFITTGRKGHQNRTKTIPHLVEPLKH